MFAGGRVGYGVDSNAWLENAADLLWYHRSLGGGVAGVAWLLSSTEADFASLVGNSTGVLLPARWTAGKAQQILAKPVQACEAVRPTHNHSALGMSYDFPGGSAPRTGHRVSAMTCHLPLDTVCISIVRHGSWEPNVYYAVRHALQHYTPADGPDAPMSNMPHHIDIGGNVGAVALAVAKDYYPTLVFEMLPKNVAVLKYSACLNGFREENFKLVVGGLSNETATCYAMAMDEGDGDAMLHCGAPDAFKPPHGSTPYHVQAQVPVSTLDLHYDAHLQPLLDSGRPIIVKIDIEGSEVKALRGATKMLTHANKPKLIMSEIWKLVNLTDYGTVMFPLGYVGWGRFLNTWVCNVAELTAYNARMERDVDELAWVLPEYAPTFLASPGQGYPIPAIPPGCLPPPPHPVANDVHV